MPSNQSAIVVVIDRLGAGFLGPYGNTWIDTPNFNRLAAESVLFDWTITDSASLEQVFQSYLQGHHAARESLLPAAESLPAWLAEKGVTTTLVSDSKMICDSELANQFASVAFLSESNRSLASSIDQTQLARTFAEAIDQIHAIDSPSLLWIQASGMQDVWDAPYELRSQFADEEDPQTPDFFDPPSLRLDDNHDPDEVLGLTHAYAGQVVVCDLCLGTLLDVLSESRVAEDTLLIVTSPRGFPLGEHGRVGETDAALYGELVHVPCFVRLPKSELASQRSQALVHPTDLFATLCEWFDIVSPRHTEFSSSLLEVARGNTLPLRDRVCSISKTEQAMRTPAWFFRRADERRELFVKPDDRWEANEISDRCAEVVYEMDQKIDEFIQAAQTDDAASLSPLSEMLISGLD